MPVPTVLIFDVNETLLDIETLTPLFQRIFGDGRVMREWFAQLVLYSQALTVAGVYTSFGSLGVGVLQMVGQTRGVSVNNRDVDELRARMRTMPAHPDVAAALQRLKTAGFRLITLTNSAPEARGNPLQRAGLAGYFERMFSVDAVKRFKPAPETYRHAGATLGVDMPSMCLVAAHAWDTLGAKAAGCAAALVARAGNASLSVEGVPQPDIVAPNLSGIADEIIRRWRRG